MGDRCTEERKRTAVEQVITDKKFYYRDVIRKEAGSFFTVFFTVSIPGGFICAL